MLSVSDLRRDMGWLEDGETIRLIRLKGYRGFLPRGGHSPRPLQTLWLEKADSRGKTGTVDVPFVILRTVPAMWMEAFAAHLRNYDAQYVASTLQAPTQASSQEIIHKNIAKV